MYDIPDGGTFNCLAGSRVVWDIGALAQLNQQPLDPIPCSNDGRATWEIAPGPSQNIGTNIILRNPDQWHWLVNDQGKIQTIPSEADYRCLAKQYPVIWNVRDDIIDSLPPGDTPATSDCGGGSVTRVSVATGGTQGDGYSSGGIVSADGRYVAFESDAWNLVPGDTNQRWDVFVHDRQTGTTSRVSVATDGTQGNSRSIPNAGALSADGRYVAFTSDASNLVPGDTNGEGDAFVHDRQTGTTTRVSVATDGTQGNSRTTDGAVALSADGRYVAFESGASNLVPGDTNTYPDVFVHDRQTGTTTRVSVATDGTQGNSTTSSGFGVSLSADGRYVSFMSASSNLVPGDTNWTIGAPEGAWDVFVHDRQTGTTTRVSVATDGTQGNGDSGGGYLSADGRYVAFSSWASNLVPGDTNGERDAFVHDRQTGTTTRVSVAGGRMSSMSADGRYFAFDSDASNLVPGDTNGKRDVFVARLR